MYSVQRVFIIPLGNRLGSDVSVAKHSASFPSCKLSWHASRKKENQGEIGLEDVLRLFKMESHCDARRIRHKNLQFSNMFFCSVHILGAVSLTKILGILFILTF